jgi:hypothetical protein
MGNLGNDIMEYGRPLLNATDGSDGEVDRALKLIQICWNLSLASEELRPKMLKALRPRMDMDDDQFREFNDKIIRVMIERHEQMFPELHSGSAGQRQSKKAVKIGRNDPCSCGSGKKYKKCCGA